MAACTAHNSSSSDTQPYPVYIVGVSTQQDVGVEARPCCTAVRRLTAHILSLCDRRAPVPRAGCVAAPLRQDDGHGAGGARAERRPAQPERRPDPQGGAGHHPGACRTLQARPAALSCGPVMGYVHVSVFSIWQCAIPWRHHQSLVPILVRAFPRLRAGLDVELLQCTCPSQLHSCQRTCQVHGGRMT